MISPLFLPQKHVQVRVCNNNHYNIICDGVISINITSYCTYGFDTDRISRCGMSHNNNRCTTYQAFDTVCTNNDHTTFCDDRDNSVCTHDDDTNCNNNVHHTPM